MIVVCNTCFNTWATAHLAELRAEYQAELDAGEFIDWSDWLVQRWQDELLQRIQAAA